MTKRIFRQQLIIAHIVRTSYHIHRHAIYDSGDEDSVEYVMPLSTAVDDSATEPALQHTKRVHRKKNSRASVQEVLLEAEGEETEWSV
jgi:hypothetical protein